MLVFLTYNQKYASWKNTSVIGKIYLKIIFRRFYQ